MLLPDVQQLRTLANALKVRFRAEVALGRFDDALRTAKTMFAMSRHLGEHPTFVGNLVGIAIANAAIGPLEEMLEQPGCPNLYWALTNLPIPLVSLDKGTEGERWEFLAEFRDLDDSAPMSADQIKRFIAHMDKLISGQPDQAQGAAGVAGRADQGRGDASIAARHRLVEYGLPEERLLRFPADQVILLDEKREYEVRLDDVMKLINLPLAGRRLVAATDRSQPRADLFADALVPACGQSQPVARHGWTSGSRCCDTSRPCASTPRSTTAHCPRSCPTSPCRCPTTRSPASRSATKLTGNTAHLRGTPRRAWKRIPASTSTTR